MEERFCGDDTQIYGTETERHGIKHTCAMSVYKTDAVRGPFRPSLPGLVTVLSYVRCYRRGKLGEQYTGSLGTCFLQLPVNI